MKTQTNIELLTAALGELSGVLDYIASERGEDDQLYIELSAERRIRKISRAEDYLI